MLLLRIRSQLYFFILELYLLSFLFSLFDLFFYNGQLVFTFYSLVSPP